MLFCYLKNAVLAEMNILQSIYWWHRNLFAGFFQYTSFDTCMSPNFNRDWHVRPLALWDIELEISNIFSIRHKIWQLIALKMLLLSWLISQRAKGLTCQYLLKFSHIYESNYQIETNCEPKTVLPIKLP